MYSTQIVYSNPFLTSAILDRISSKVTGLSYMPCNLNWRGNPAIQAGDKIQVKDRSGETHTVLVMSQVINFGGGLSSQISCPGDTDDEAASATTQTVGQQIATAVGKVNTELQLYVAECCDKMLAEAKEYADGKFDSIINGNEVAW